MSSKYVVTVEEGYVRVKSAPGYEITLDRFAEIWEVVSDLCRQKRYKKVLVEGRDASLRMNTPDLFNAGTCLSQGRVYGLMIAFCLPGAETEYSMPGGLSEVKDFFKTVCANRGIEVDYFQDVPMALRWLGVTRLELATVAPVAQCYPNCET